MSERLILVTNDDGIYAKGLEALVDAVKQFGHVLVIAPHEGQSSMAHAITVKVPIRIEKIKGNNGVDIYSCSGTPVDCIKLAINHLVTTTPSLVVSGINHGSNASASIIYSGTMAAAIEGCLNGIPSIGFSLLDFSRDADFSGAKKHVKNIIEKVLREGLQAGTCLNVNIPKENVSPVKGIRICRQTKGFWQEEFDRRTDPMNREYFWLTGEFNNMEPDSEDTDEWALAHNYISIVPVKVDFTDYDSLQQLKKWETA